MLTALLDDKPNGVEVVLTGRNPLQNLWSAAITTQSLSAANTLTIRGFPPERASNISSFEKGPEPLPHHSLRLTAKRRQKEYVLIFPFKRNANWP